MDSRIPLGSCAAALLAGAGPAGAQQWHATVLPSGLPNATARAAYGTSQGGTIDSGQSSTSVPVLWEGAAGNVNSLLPAGLTAGAIRGMSGSHQVGGVSVAGTGHAALWSGTTASFVDLHPGPQGSTSALAVSGEEQAGVMITPAGAQQAAVWHGTPGSFVNLNPAGASSSCANATDGTHQGGFAMIGSGSHAALWSGTAASFVDLSPPGVLVSGVWAMAPGVQAGNVGGHAVLWTGAASTIVDVNPLGSGFSRIYGTTGTVHVGEFQTQAPAAMHAGLWFGTSAAGFMDLHSLLPVGYTSSTAFGVYEQNGWVWVAGDAFDGTNYHAILWTNVCYANCDGSTTVPVLNVNDFGCFINRFQAGDGYANCDGSTTPPVLNVLDFMCFVNAFAAGCS